MIEKSRLKLIKSLQLKKYRNLEGLFLVEGEKSVLEVIDSDFEIQFIVATSPFISKYKEYLNKLTYYEVSEDRLSKAGSFKTNQQALAVVKQRNFEIPQLNKDSWYLALDDISDPGNLGTILRIADWYGVEAIFLSNGCTDVYNPKVISSSKGSFTRVKYIYTDIEALLIFKDINFYGAFLEGMPINNINFPTGGVLIMGSESHGINPKFEKFIKNKINIPGKGGAESLNVAVSTGIILDRIFNR